VTGSLNRMKTKRLGTTDREQARQLFTLMAEVFEEDHRELDDAYIEGLLRRADFWVIAAFADDELIGGVTAHTLPMTRSRSSELFIYDVAVRPDHQREGAGRELLAALREQAAAIGIHDVFVAADNDDRHALSFYRALGGVSSAVAIFTFSDEEPVVAPAPR
jgi:aminoglycoside 3-N-acetyltransferase I